MGSLICWFDFKLIAPNLNKHLKQQFKTKKNKRLEIILRSSNIVEIIITPNTYIYNPKFMNMKISGLILLATFFISTTFGQSNEELAAQKTEKEAKVAELQGQIDGLNDEIAAIAAKLVVLPRWETGAFGSLGLSFNGFSNWVSRDQANIASSTIGVALNVFANSFAEKTFWRSAANVNMGWIKFDDKDDATDNPEFRQSADVINITSLFGYKLNAKLAASALGEYRSTIISNFNNPGYLDLGIGATWTPAPNFVIVIHPLNQNFVFSDDTFNYQSSTGAKVIADYTKEVIKGFNWKSNLSVFQSYKGNEFSNWTWVNSVAISLVKGFGIGGELGLRNNKQEALAKDLTDNPLQTYYVVGITYNITSK